MKTNGKQINANLVFSDMKEAYHTELTCQLDTGATCNVMIANRRSTAEKQQGQAPTI